VPLFDLLINSLRILLHRDIDKKQQNSYYRFVASNKIQQNSTKDGS